MTAPLCTLDSLLGVPCAVNVDKAGVEQVIPALFLGL